MAASGGIRREDVQGHGGSGVPQPRREGGQSGGAMVDGKKMSHAGLSWMGEGFLFVWNWFEQLEVCACL
jgi:hypothetical protein